MNPQTLKYYIEHLINFYREREVIIYKKKYHTERWSYLDLYNFTHKVAAFFTVKGISKGDKILIYAPNRPEWDGIFLGCALSGVIAVPIDFNSRPQFASNIYKEVEAKLIFVSIYKQVEGTNQVYIEDLRYILESIDQKEINVHIDENTILEIVYTSGTTSDPKGVIITNKNLVWNIRSIGKVMPLEKNSVLLSILPLSHLFEQVIGFLNCLRYGAKIVYLESRKSSQIIEVLKQEKITNIVTVPIFLALLKKKIEARITDQRKFNTLLKIFKTKPLFLKKIIFGKIHKKLGEHLKFFMVGGAFLDSEIEDFWNSIGITVFQGYGLTETSPVVSCNTPSERKEHSAGKVIPNVKIKIDQDGEILVKGPNVTPGYYQNPDETKKHIQEGWLSTGDIGVIDKDGYLFLKGRKKDMILSSSGINIYPEDIEYVLNRIEEVKDSCVFGEEKEGKTMIIAAILLKGETNPQEVMRKANKQLNLSQQINKIIAWPEEDFPRTSTLKIKKSEVARRLKSKEPIFKKTIPKNRLLTLLSKFTSGSITKKSNLMTDLKIDSVYRVELLAQIDEEYDVEISEDSINQNTTVKDLENLIEKATKVSTRQGFKTWPLNIGVLRSFFQQILFIALRLFCKLEVIGKENLVSIKKPAIFVANHNSHLDTPIILKALPFYLRKKMAVAAAADYFFEGKFWLPIFVRIFLNAYPFSRTSAIRRSLKYSGWLMDQGYSILNYPEGTRSIDGKMGNFKIGIGMMVKEMDAWVVPLRLTGTHKILPKGRSLPKRGKVQLIFSEPLIFSYKDSYVDIARRLEKTIKTLQ